MSVRPTEYGRRGIVGIGVPQANPTVEPELQLLRPAGVSLVTARLFSPSRDPATRIRDYLERMDDALLRFDDLSLDAFAFACTGSTYLVGHEREQAIVGALARRFDYPVLTAAAAIEAALRHIGARRILLVAPYPDWLAGPGVAYWQDRGFEVTALRQVRLPSADTHGIYALGSAQAEEAIRGEGPGDADTILLSGTGMPSLRVLTKGQRLFGRPVLSSNACLAWHLARQLQLPEPAEPTLGEGWAERIEQL
jgi:maleate isomerase